MWIDLIFLIVIIGAIAKGVRRGLIIALFSFVALFVGLAAALKLSAHVANYLRHNTHIEGKWLPVLSFILLFVAVVLLIRWGAEFISTAFDFAMLGWVNKLAGALLYVGMYTLIFSVVLFYADKMHLISEKTEKSSITYGMIAPLAPTIIDGLGSIIPLFKNMFRDLEDFFENIHKDLPKETTQVF
ncbi:MAG: colicin V production protein [Bacteroidetes bacterium]|nr:MAG: colicin V production protein [Bacteroidota bacterium]